MGNLPVGSSRQIKIALGSYPMGLDAEDQSDNFFTVVKIDPNADDDQDGFKNGLEMSLGTDYKKACPENSSDHAWPPDTNNNRYINGGDVSTLVPYISGVKAYDNRYDLNLDGIITKDDVIPIAKFFLQECNAADPNASPVSSVISNLNVPVAGDINQNREVDVFDFAQFVTAFRKETMDPRIDFNQDSEVDIFDFNILVRNFGRTY